ncbi:competence/damage-inducible protein A [soil metagenome]
MIVEVVAVGTELLLGQIVNGNAAHIGSRLAEQGFDAHYQQVVGDNLDRMESALRIAIERADAVIVTGGIGPTQDDITREAMCAATDLAMDHSDSYEAALRERWERSGRVMPPSNIRQADHPHGAELLPNPKGSAPGLALRHEDTWIFALPGVPQEMELLLSDHVIPRLRASAGVEEVLVSRLLRSWGRSESQVADELDELYTSSVNPSMAFLASAGEIKIRLSAKAADHTAAESLISPFEAEVRRRLGGSVFAVDDETIESVLLTLLRRRSWTIGTAESVTGGGVAARLTSVPGASEVFRGSVVAYHSEIKDRLLGVDVGAGVVNEAAAVAMAEGARRVLSVDVAVSTTGEAGPTGLERHPGTVVIGVVTPEGSRSHTLVLPGDRERVRAYTATAALQHARLAVEGTWWATA